MRIVFALVLVTGLGLAGFAVFMAQGYVSRMSAERDALLAAKQSAPPMTRVLALAEAKAYGEPLTPQDVKWIVWQQDSLPEGAFQEEGALFPEGQPNRYVISAMQQFEPVLAAKITEPGEDAGLTSRLSRGMRAFAIKVDVASGVSGFLRPGDRVDVYWTGQLSGQSITKMIETSVRIIAVDQIADTNRSDPVIARTVTVEASPAQVAALAQAQSTGRLSLSLVGTDDDIATEMAQVDQRKLLGIAETAPIEEIERQVCRTKVRRGAEVILQEIPCTD
ncbi:Flp pilus assembly protein CpaB [Tropicimonas sp.]|uniref:Flp pilus assembly protein CpaB n=1 Tax=Tropicimonas sp. TaxID=2067044 RepID=UPI003A8497E0